MKRLLVMVLTLGLFATAAYAHNGMIHVMGTVTSITDTSISVKGADGKIQTVAFAPTTKFLRGETAIAAKDIKVGDHTVVHATKKGEQLIAAEVKLGAMKMTVMSGDMNGMKMDHPAATTPH
ncbi:MAG: DUF5666 domain-containing protein [Acidobacteriota bacterium]|nr:DUF5666 domain-containing protein [Acidobacteriota bacterium]